MKIYCINLENRTDKKFEAQQEFDREGLDVEFIKAIDGRIDTPVIRTFPAEYGCSMSHTFVWKDIVKNDHQVALVFEDDVKLVPDFKNKIDLLLKEDVEWDIINLGALTSEFISKISDTLNEGGSLGTHAYLITLACATKIHQFDPKYMKAGIDNILTWYPIRMVYTKDILARQGDLTLHPLIGFAYSAMSGDIGIKRSIDLDFIIKHVLYEYILMALICLIIYIQFA